MTHAPLIYVIAGEASGDLLGARLMASLKEKTGGRVRFAGIGGPLMEREGLRSLFPCHDLSVMGFIEIVPHLPRLLLRFLQARRDILRRKPDMLLTIDSPGFNFPLARAVRRARGRAIRLAHYVAPTVWAYRPERARAIAAVYDHLLLLLPFEKPYFDRAGLAATFVGHPAIREPLEAQAQDRDAFRERHGILPSTKTLCMLPGSRGGELRRHLPVFRETAAILARRYRDFTAVMPLSRRLLPLAARLTQGWPGRLVLTESETGKAAAFAACDAALCKSGTVTLEAARAGLPMAVTYRVSACSARRLRRMIRVKYVTIINLILDAPAIPELLQEDCTPEKLAAALIPLLEDPAARETQRAAAQSALRLMGLGADASPSGKAADAVLGLLPPSAGS